MVILIVDDYKPSVRALSGVLSEVLGDDTEILTASSGEEALRLAEDTPVDVAFLGVVMPGMGGLECARRLTALRETTDIVIVTAFPEHALDAWRIHASDFLLKPVTEADVRTALANLRHPLPRGPKRLRVQCFGNFAVFAGSERIHFKRSGAQELLAYLVSRRGASVSTGELCSVLWEDDINQSLEKSYIRTFFSCLRRTLRAYGLEGAVRHERDSYSVNTKLLDCDYYRFLERDPLAAISYHSEFMHQYSWAEPMAYQIENLAHA